jgi:hypothetical protein
MSLAEPTLNDYFNPARLALLGRYSPAAFDAAVHDDLETLHQGPLMLAGIVDNWRTLPTPPAGNTDAHRVMPAAQAGTETPNWAEALATDATAQRAAIQEALKRTAAKIAAAHTSLQQNLKATRQAQGLGSGPIPPADSAGATPVWRRLAEVEADLAAGWPRYQAALTAAQQALTAEGTDTPALPDWAAESTVPLTLPPPPPEDPAQPWHEAMIAALPGPKAAK